MQKYDNNKSLSSKKGAHVLLKQASDYIRYTNKIWDDNKIKILSQLQPSLIDWLKMVFWKKYLPLNIPQTQDQIRDLLSLYIENDDTINTIMNEYKSDIWYRNKIESQTESSDKFIINTSDLLSQLSKDAKSHLYSVNKKHSLPMSDLAIMAATAKSCEKTSQIFVLSYLPIIVDISRMKPLMWNDLVDCIVLSYKYDFHNVSENIYSIHRGEDIWPILLKLKDLEKEYIENKLVNDEE